MITNEIIQRVVQIMYKSNTATGFTIEKEGKQHIITAKHMFPTVKNGDNAVIAINYISGWKNIEVSISFLPDKDIAVLSLISVTYITKVYPVNYNSVGMMYGQDVYFLGFPYGLCMKGLRDINDGLPLPLIKKACLSAFDPESRPGILLLDGQNNKGFSGGPVCYSNNGVVTVIGVISGYSTEINKVFEPSGIPSTSYIQSNTGIIIAYDIKYVHEILQSL